MDTESYNITNKAYLEYLSSRFNGDPDDIQALATDLLEIYARYNRPSRGPIMLKTAAKPAVRASKASKAFTEMELHENEITGKKLTGWNYFVKLVPQFKSEVFPARQLRVTPTVSRPGVCTGRAHAGLLTDYEWGRVTTFGDLIDAGVAAKLSDAQLGSMLWFVLNDDDRLLVRQPVEVAAPVEEPEEFEVVND
jgi:hypothetical protein